MSRLLFALIALALAPLSHAGGSKRSSSLRLHEQAAYQLFTLQNHKDKSVTIRRGEDLERVRFHKDVLELWSADGEVIPFALSKKIETDREGNPSPFEDLSVAPAVSGQSAQLRIVQLSRDYIDTSSTHTIECPTTTTHRICRGTGLNQVCEDVSITSPSTRTVTSGTTGYYTKYRLTLASAQGARLFSSEFTSDDTFETGDASYGCR